jgi:hypothetical protein
MIQSPILSLNERLWVSIKLSLGLKLAATPISEVPGEDKKDTLDPSESKMHGDEYIFQTWQYLPWGPFGVLPTKFETFKDRSILPWILLKAVSRDRWKPSAKRFFHNPKFCIIPPS